MTSKEEKEDKEEDEDNKKKSKDEKHMDKVTEFHEEKEIDASKAHAAISSIGSDDKAAKEKALREAQLAQLVVKKEDVDLLTAQLEISEKRADRLLRESNNSVVDALRAFVDRAATREDYTI
eukprot:TRINITY_DN9664_c0_g1_i1.p1 TRINITY_DN9664_c0_g1~~TRINITY_DN9664_c0_g1_i1.p1  ORF type:complete len:133 (-),score=47.72 TRINITY_DN9664_c0_g1_i1:268-633(-)